MLFLLTSTARASETDQEYIAKAKAAFIQADIVNAIHWYRKAAELNNAEAQTRLAYLLDNSEENDEAIKWYQKAVVQGYAEAFYGLGIMYAAGEGVKPDEAKAFDLFAQAATKGHAPSIRALAVTYEKGDLGQPIDYELAVEWLQAGVEVNDPWAITRLARAYQRGELGLRIDNKQASQLLQKLPAS
jgi:TPR repeat protein